MVMCEGEGEGERGKGIVQARVVIVGVKALLALILARRVKPG